MRKIILMLSLVIILSGLFTFSGCKNDKGYDIANGSWGFRLFVDDVSVAVLVYDFEGTEDEGLVYYQDQNRGNYTVTGKTQVNFTVNHHDIDSNIFVYLYSGQIIDYYNMSGSFTVTYPNGDISHGTWVADR